VRALGPRESADAEAQPRPGRRRSPWWIPPFLGRAPVLEPRLERMLGLVTLGMFFEAYDLSLLTAALKHIAADLGIGEGDLGLYLSAVRIGGLLAFLILPVADQVGRRRLFLVSLIGMSVGTLATAFSQTPEQFVAFQILSRAFLASAAALGVVMLTEEFPAAHRGWAIGMLGALSAVGYGVGALLFAAVDLLPFGWRALYAIGVLPLLLLPMFRRALAETARFRQHRASRGGAAGGSLRSLLDLARHHPGRAMGVGLAGMLSSLGAISVFAFASYFAQTVHHWEPWQYSAMLVTSGGVGIVGNVVAGRLGDRYGRRAVGLVAFVLYPIAAIAFYNGPGWLLPAGFALIVFSSSAGDVMLRALSTELFPTSQRGASVGWLTLLQTAGYIAGPWLVSGGVRRGEELTAMISLLAGAVSLAGLMIWLLPETRARELEELSPEDAPASLSGRRATRAAAPDTEASP
jgi:MFS family permease